MHATHESHFPKSSNPSSAVQADFSSWVAATRDPAELVLGFEGLVYADLYRPEALAKLSERFFRDLAERDPEALARFAAYRDCKGEGMKAEAVSEALLGVAPHVSRFVARLFRVEPEMELLLKGAEQRQNLWVFKKEFARKRLFKSTVGKAWTGSADEAAALAKMALGALGLQPSLLGSGSTEEELSLATAALRLVEVDEVARKAAKAGGATWTDAHRALALEVAKASGLVGEGDDAALAGGVARALDALEAWLQARRQNAADGAHHWLSLKAPHTLDHENLVQIRRPDASLPEAFVGPEGSRRDRDGFALTDRRAGARSIDAEVDYCLLCHDRDKDSCSKGLRDNKTGAIKPNPLGVELNGCPLGEKISEMHTLRQGGDVLGALALICIDNPMLPGTGHRICNDCMKACVYQKQEPVNIPSVETSVLTDVLALPWGFEIYGFLTRWNPLNITRPHSRAYNGKNVLIVGLGPAGYTLAHHLTAEGFACAAIDGLKVEPLPVELTGDETRSPRPIRDFKEMYLELDERILLGLGGVSEYGITVRWDKNFLTVLYVTLARQRLLRTFGGVRFGGTLDIEDAWRLGFDHVAIAAGAGRPTVIPLKNNLARGIRKASDFLMGLQLSGAYKRSSLSNMQVRLPAIVIGGGLTAIDTATELLAYYVVQAEKTSERLETLIRERGEAFVMNAFDAEERAFLEEQRAHGAALREERARAAAEGREPSFQPLLQSWGGVSLVYRKRVVDSPAYRLNHEEVAESLQEGVRYVENMVPVEAKLDERDHLKGVVFERQVQREGAWVASGELVELPARTLCVAAGTAPNVTYEKEKPSTFVMDARKQYYRAHRAWVDDAERLVVEPSDKAAGAFFTSYDDGVHAVSYYGDNHPHYAGSVVKAMASAKDAYPSVVQLFRHDLARLDREPQEAREERRRALFSKLDDEWLAKVETVTRLTSTIVEVIVRAPAAARKFEPGQFYRLQNYEHSARWVEGTRLAMEGLALTGAWVDKEKGLLSMIALEMGASTRLLAALRPGDEVVVMGPTGTPTEIPSGETVLLAGGGLGNAVLFSIAKALRARGDRVVYFAGYKKGEDLFKQEEIEVATDQVIWCTDSGVEIAPRRPTDHHFRGNIVQAMVAYAEGKFGGEITALAKVSRIIAIGSDRMMNAVREARHGVLARHLNPKHVGIASINSPMQCMMKEVCAQCLQKHIDPATGKETVVFTCFNQDQEMDHVDFKNLNARLRSNTAQEKLASLWLERLLERAPDFARV